MSKKPTGAAAGNSEAIRIYERIEDERKQRLRRTSLRAVPERSLVR